MKGIVTKKPLLLIFLLVTACNLLPLSEEEYEQEKFKYDTGRYTVTYDGNGNTGGTAPADYNKYPAGATVTVKGNTGGLIKAGYTYSAWNTRRNGSGITYSQGQTFSIGMSDVTLYAVWTLTSYHTLSYDGNGNTGGNVPSEPAMYGEGETVTVLGNTGNLVKTAHRFSGWDTRADGWGNKFAAGDTFTMGSYDITLYAMWIQDPSVPHISGTEAGSGEVTVTWSVVMEADHYNLYWAPGTTVTTATGTRITTSSSHKTVDGLTNGVMYAFAVTAVNSNGESEASPVVTATPTPVWGTVGSAGFSAGEAQDISLAIDSVGTLYVGYRDSGNGNRATVMKYDGSSWVPVGNAGFSSGMVRCTSLAIDSSDTLHVAYRDVENGNKATVMKYDGSSWVAVGNAGFTPDYIMDISLAFDSGDTPYVAYTNGQGSMQVSVMKFDGLSWVIVGNPDFSAGPAEFDCLAIDSKDTPYVAYMDYGNNNKATVMKLDGSTWVPVGSTGFSPGEAHWVSLALDEQDTPYIAFIDWTGSYRATVMKYDGSTWVSIGNPGFQYTLEMDISLVLDATGTPYVVFGDHVQGYKATVRKRLGSSWVTVGNPAFSAGQAYYLSIAISPDDIPIVAYQDGMNGNRTTVMECR